MINFIIKEQTKNNDKMSYSVSNTDYSKTGSDSFLCELQAELGKKREQTKGSWLLSGQRGAPEALGGGRHLALLTALWALGGCVIR